MLNVDDKPLKGFVGLYWINKNGSVNNGRRTLKTFTNKGGYHCLKLHDADGIRRNATVHRLVAQQWLIPSCVEATEVNHIDGNKDNNELINLEWVTSAENKAHAKQTGLWAHNKPTLGKKIGKGSRFRGVCFDNSRSKWLATVRRNGKNLMPKRFDTEEEAAEHFNFIMDHFQFEGPRNVI